jgi:hypothetical protein
MTTHVPVANKLSRREVEESRREKKIKSKKKYVATHSKEEMFLLNILKSFFRKNIFFVLD